ncbi:MAG: hypothetical protein MO847_00800 [Candidatus Protistobacter heckmanni]|nr:hypothetical protein [Candidatus Protistobacter heckmanni]
MAEPDASGRQPAGRGPGPGAAHRLRPGGQRLAEELGETLRWLGAEGQIAVQETLVETELVAEIETPAGVRALQ